MIQTKVGGSLEAISW